MPRLTEMLCATRRPVKKYKNPLHPATPAAFKQKSSAALKNKVNPKELSARASRVCQPELATMLQCLKSNDFQETPCAKEIAAFYSCHSEHQRRQDVKDSLKERGSIGLSTRDMNGRQCNDLLNKFPQPRKPAS